MARLSTDLSARLWSGGICTRWMTIRGFAYLTDSSSSSKLFRTRCAVCSPKSGSMGSIKRDVKKKVLPRPEARCFLEIQLTGIRLRWRSVTCAHCDESPLVSKRYRRVGESDQRMATQGQPWFYPRLVAFLRGSQTTSRLT